jgi:hypothetical protein
MKNENNGQSPTEGPNDSEIVKALFKECETYTRRDIDAQGDEGILWVDAILFNVMEKVCGIGERDEWTPEQEAQYERVIALKGMWQLEDMGFSLE